MTSRVKSILLIAVILGALAAYVWAYVRWSPVVPCGGVAGRACPSGYACQISDPAITDSVGRCVKNP